MENLPTKKSPVRKPPQKVRDAQFDLDRAVVRNEPESVIQRLTDARDAAVRATGWKG